MVAGEAIAVVARHVSRVIEKGSVRAEIVGTTRPPCLVCLRPEFVGHVCGDFGFLDTFAVDGGGGFVRATQCGHERYATRDNLLYLVDEASTLTIGSLHQPVGG